MSDDDLAAEVRQLRTEVEALRRRVAELEATESESESSEAATDAPHPDDAGEPTAGGEPSTAAKRQEDADVDAADAPIDDADATSSAADSDATVAVDEPTGASDESPTAAAAQMGEQGADWERNLGIKWLGVAGGVALVFGVVFFVRLAIERGLLGPLGRVTVGTVGGLALLAGGRFAAERQGYVRWGRITAGVGLAVAYFSCYAAYGFETYRTALGTPLWAVLLALTALVGGAVVTSVRDRAPVVAGEAFTLGYITAVVGLEAETFVVTPAYALLLAAGLVGIAVVRPWSRLVVASIVPTYALAAVWIVATDPAMALATAVGIAALGIYVAGGYVLRGHESDSRWYLLQIRALTVLNAGLGALYLELVVREWVPNVPLEGIGFAAVGLALVGVYAVTDRQPVRRDETAGILAVVLIGVSVVLAGGTFAATVGLLAVVCGAVAVSSRTGADAFRAGAHLVAAGTVYKLLGVDATDLPAFDPTAPLATLTGRPAAFLLAILVFYGLAWWYRDQVIRQLHPADAIPLAAPYAVAGTGLTVVLLGLELSGVGISVAWALLGLALVTGGLHADSRGLRLQGIAVLGLVTAKVFVSDTQGLDPIARVVAFLVLGTILLVASYGYARRQGDDPFSQLTGE